MAPMIRLSLAFVVAMWSQIAGGVSAATVTSASFPALTEAIASSTNVQFSFNGIIQFPAPIIIDRRIEIDGTGRNVVFDGRNANQLFIVTTNGDLTIRGITLQNGVTPNTEPGSKGLGGAVVVTNALLTLVNCSLKNNSAHGGPFKMTPAGCIECWEIVHGGYGEGGAVAAIASRVVFTGCTFESNSALGRDGSSLTSVFAARPGGGFGGSIYGERKSDIEIDHCVFRSNTVLGGKGSWKYGALFGGAVGSAIFTDTSVAMTMLATSFMQNRSIEQNFGSAVACGGVVAYGCSFVNNPSGALSLTLTGIVTRCLFRNNASSGAVGGAGISHGQELLISQCTFISNRAVGGPWSASSSWPIGNPYVPPGRALGGAISGFGLKATNCIFQGNSVRSGEGMEFALAPGAGGAAIAGRGTTEIVHCSFSGNFVESSSYPDPAIPISGSAIWIATNAAPANLQACAISGPTGVSLVAGPITDAGFNVSGDATPTFTQASSLNNTDPLLQLFPQAPFSILRPAPGSPAIDRVSVHIADYDIRGILRPLAGADSGAVEIGAVTPLTIASSNGSLNIAAPAYTEPVRLLGSTDLKTWNVIGSAFVSSLNVPITGPYRFFKVQFDP